MTEHGRKGILSHCKKYHLKYCSQKRPVSSMFSPNVMTPPADHIIIKYIPAHTKRVAHITQTNADDVTSNTYVLNNRITNE